MDAFIQSLIDGSRHQEQMAEAKRLMAAGRPAKKKIRYFPRRETVEACGPRKPVMTLTGIEQTDDDVFAVFKINPNWGM